MEYSRKFTKNVMVLGEVTKTTVLIEGKDDYPVSLEGTGKRIDQFTYIAGATTLEFLLQASREYIDRRNSDFTDSDVCRYAKSDIFSEERLVWGPSSIEKEADRRKLAGQARTETIKLGVTHTTDADTRDSFEGYRQTDYHGAFPASALANDPVKQRAPAKDSSPVLALAVDFDDFLSVHSLEKYLASPIPDSFSAAVVRLQIRPQPLNDSKLAELQQTVSKNLAKVLATAKDRVAVISAESLRACGKEISYRVTWERTVMDTHRVLSGILQSTGAPAAFALDCLESFDWIVVTYANDGAMIVNVAELSSGNGSIAFVGDPRMVEKDYSRAFGGKTHGTHLLLSAAIALNFACTFDNAGPNALSQLRLFSNDNAGKMRKLLASVTLGLKASRHLQAHAFVTLEQEMRSLVQRGNFDASGDRGEALNKLCGEWNRIHDARYFLWNRLQSTRYMDKYQELFLGHPPRGDNSGVASWPFGDLVEILCDGFPTYGSFPPTSFQLKEGRLEIQKQTDKVARAWSRAGWLCHARVKFAGSKIGSYDGEAGSGPLDLASEWISTSHDQAWWSFRQESLNEVAEAVIRADSGLKAKDINKAVTDAFAGSLALYGIADLNQRGEKSRARFDLRFAWQLLERLRDLYQKEQALNRADMSVWPSIEQRILKEWIFDVDEPTDDERAMMEQIAVNRQSAFPNPSLCRDNMESLLAWKEPTFHRLLGMIPELKIGELYSIDRREIQSYREIEERLLNYRESKIEKPLNIAVFGAPGDGKSFAVKEILNDVYKHGDTKVEFLEYNLAQFSSPSELTDAMQEIQNAHLNGKFPVAFWDEYDTKYKGLSLGWLSFFLGPMQDGRFFVNQRSRKLPKCIFIFAGSMFGSFGSMRALDRLSRGMDLRTNSDECVRALDGDTHVGRFACDDWTGAKGSDFKSRLTGALDITGVTKALDIIVSNVGLVKTESDGKEIISDVKSNPLNVSLRSDENSAKIRRGVIIRRIFEKEAKWLIDKNGELAIAPQVLNSFLSDNVEFEHGIRSLESIIRMSSLDRRSSFDNSVVPTSAQMRIHGEPDMFPAESQLE